MSVQSERSFPRAEARPGPWAAYLVALALFTGSWLLLHVGFWDNFQIVDTPVYEEYGERMRAGEVPYRDFEVEYPPAALLVFLLPTFGGDDYAAAFELLMWLCGAGCLAAAATVLGGVRADGRRLLAAAVFLGLAPLALGTVLLTRYDLWPAMLTAAAIAGLVLDKRRLALGLLALAAAAKLYPLVLLPLALVHVGRRHGARAALAALGVFAAVLAAIVVPFAVLAPGGLADSLGSQLGRPLQIESLGAGVLLAAHRLGVYDASVVSSHGSQNLAGGLPDAFATMATALQAAAVLAAWALFAARPRGTTGLLAASAAAVTAFVAFGKVLSPQFLIWLIPLVPLLAGRVGVAAGSLFAAALVLTQVWFPYRYWDVVALERVAWLVPVRDLVLAALAVLLLVATARARARPRSA